MSNTGNWNTGDRNTGYWNTGDWNTGYWNTGDWNTGDWNTGNRNTGNMNTGDWNTGDWNTGDRNTGYWNTGDWNTGNRNTGNMNTGDWNTGDWNTGHWNTGDRNTGYFNIDAPKVRIFWKETDIKIEDINFPSFCYFNLTEWIDERNMTEEEKQADENEYYKTTGWYLKTYKYQEAFKNSYNKLSKQEREEQIAQLKALPNFDADIFKQISWIDIDAEEKKKIIIDWKEVFLSLESFEKLKKSLID